MIKFQEFKDTGIPEVQPELEEEFSEIDSPIEIKFWNFVFCVGLFCGLLLGCGSILSEPKVLDSNPEVFFFTLFYISVEVACMITSVPVFLCFWAVAYLKNKPVKVYDYIGILLVVCFTMSSMAHLLAIPIGCLLLARNPVIPIVYKSFICFQILFAIFILGKFLFGHRNGPSRFPEVFHNDAILKATVEIENIRSRENSVHSLQNSFQGGREIRSISSHEGSRNEEETSPRERSDSTGNKLRLKIAKTKN